VWRSSDRGETWSLASNRLVIDDQSMLWRYDSGWLETKIEGSYLASTHRALAAGATAAIEVEAQQIALWSIRAPAMAGLEIAVDDAPWTVDLAGEEAFGAAWCEEVVAGRRAVTVEATGEPAHVDALAIWVPGLAAPICPTTSPEEPRCACDTSGAAAPWWALVAGVWGRRRRRHLVRS